MLARRPRTTRRHPDGGASAVEFALVMPVLFLLVFGIIDYGMLFFDRSACARAPAKVPARPSSSCPAPPAPPGAVSDKVVCADQAGHREHPGRRRPACGSRSTSSDGAWSKGAQLIVCIQVKEKSPHRLRALPRQAVCRPRRSCPSSRRRTASTRPRPAEAAPTGGDLGAHGAELTLQPCCARRARRPARSPSWSP